MCPLLSYSLAEFNDLTESEWGMERLIRVELADGVICRMVQKAFDLFLAQDKIIKFERTDGWVVVGNDPMRNMSKRTEYVGTERRVAF